VRILIWLFCVIISGLYVLQPIVDPDLWWHIAIGKWILSHGTVPLHEHWNLYALGKPFIAYSWMTEVLFAWAESKGGIDWLFWIKAILIQAVGLSFCFVFSKLSRDWFFGLLLGVIALVGCQSHFTLRPQSVTWLYFIWIIYFCDLAVRRERVFPAAIGIFCLMSLWANIHITTIIGLGVIVLWTIEKKNLALTSWLLLFGVLGTLCTPYLGGEWITFFSKTSHPLEHSSIIEFQPATILQYATGFPLIGIFLLGTLVFLQPLIVLPFRFVLCAGLLFGGLAVVKFLPYATIVIFATIASVWGRGKEHSARFGNLSEAVEKFRSLFGSRHLPLEGVGFILVCFIYVLVKQSTETRLETAIVPSEPIAFMVEKDIRPPFLHTFGYGGYLMYHFSQHEGEGVGDESTKVIIDGRTNVTPPDIQEMIGNAFGGNGRWEEILSLYQPNAVLWHGDSPFVSLLLLTGDWCTIYEVPESILKHTVLIKKDEYEARKGDFPNAQCRDRH
jgi:hypothetical protein